VNSVKEFIAYAKERQGQLTYGSTGEGSMANLVDHAVHEADRREDGARALQGGPLALNDLIAATSSSSSRCRRW
jgi:tripartite-type tricarboxylate transporter receptor subunit TctC